MSVGVSTKPLSLPTTVYQFQKQTTQ